MGFHMGKRKKSTYNDRFIQLNPLQILASGFIFLILLGGLLLNYLFQLFTRFDGYNPLSF